MVHGPLDLYQGKLMSTHMPLVKFAAWLIIATMSGDAGKQGDARNRVCSLPLESAISGVVNSQLCRQR